MKNEIRAILLSSFISGSLPSAPRREPAGGSLRLLMVQEIMTREPEMQRVTHRSNHLTSEAYTVPLEVLHHRWSGYNRWSILS